MHQLHDEIMLAVISAPRFVDCRYPRMFESRQGPRFALKQFDLILIHEPPAANNLQPNESPGVLLLGLVDNAHAPFTELAEDSIIANQDRGHRRRSVPRFGRVRVDM